MMSISPVAGQRPRPSIQKPGQYPSPWATPGCLMDAVTIISPPGGAPNSRLARVSSRPEVHAAPGLPAAPWPRAMMIEVPVPVETDVIR